MTSAGPLQTLHDVLDRHIKLADLLHLLAQWRHDAMLVPLAILPSAYDRMRRSLLQRLDMVVLFGEGSCSFSPSSLLAEMHLWTDKAETKLASM